MTPSTPYPMIPLSDGKPAAVHVTEWLSLAAAPIFMIMALLTALRDGSMPEMLCLAAQDTSPLTGMVPMYLLMSAFHLTPWLKLISRWRGGVQTP